MNMIINKKYNKENLYTHRELLLAWVLRTVKARYQQTVIGGLWAIIQPAAATIIFSIIFTNFIPIETGETPYIVFSYTAMVPWTLLSGSIIDMVDSLVINMNLVSKIYFPREILPIALLLARLFDFVIASTILGLLLILFRIPFSYSSFLLPFIVLTQLALVAGIGLAGSALNVFYRDIKHIFNLGLQIWLYATPVIYPISAVPKRFQMLYYLNPMVGIIQSYRDILLSQKMPGQYFMFSIFSSLLLLTFGYWLFKHVEHQFADVV